MKKFIILILSIVYMTTTNGMVFSNHFCMGNKPTKKCLCSKTEKKSDCCKDEFKVVKLDNAHNAAIINIELKSPVTILPSPIATVDDFKLSGLLRHQPQILGPPIFSPPNIYLLNCVFRI